MVCVIFLIRSLFSSKKNKKGILCSFFAFHLSLQHIQLKLNQLALLLIGVITYIFDPVVKM